MLEKVKLIASAVAALAMVVAALWAWQNAGAVWDDATRPEVAAWAVRSGAVALAAGAQALLLVAVVNPLFHDTRGGGVTDTLLRFTAAGVSAVCVVSAVALGLAAR